MLIIDGDYPMAFGALELNRDLTLPVHEIRRDGAGQGLAFLDDPDAISFLEVRLATHQTRWQTELGTTI